MRDVDYDCHPDQTTLSESRSEKCGDINLGGESHEHIWWGQVSTNDMKRK